jgi:hypothetical protein
MRKSDLHTRVDRIDLNFGEINQDKRNQRGMVKEGQNRVYRSRRPAISDALIGDAQCSLQEYQAKSNRHLQGERKAEGTVHSQSRESRREGCTSSILVPQSPDQRDGTGTVNSIQQSSKRSLTYPRNTLANCNTRLRIQQPLPLRLSFLLICSRTNGP